jgi:uncharacterized protein YdaU (DUF1376 family)
VHEYDHHIGDYTRDTVGLSLAEDGAYRRLMDQYYASELPLPVDIREVYRAARATSGADRKAVDYVLERYFTLREDGWHQGRIDREIAEHQGRSGTARASAEIRWARVREREERRRSHANAMQTHSERNAKAMRTPCETDAARARRLPPSVLPKSDVGVNVAITSPDNGGDSPKVNGAFLKTEGQKPKAPGQQWSKPAYVEATAKTLGIQRRVNEDDEAFKDRVYTAVRDRRQGTAH